MKLLRQYLTTTVLMSTALVMLVLLALAGFIEFIAQLDDTGTGSYTAFGAFVYTSLRLPLLAVEMLPVATLLGALLGLGALAASSELVAMRAAGISAFRLARNVALSGVILALAGIVLGEFMAPPMDQFARKYRSAARNQADLSGEQNTWVRDGKRIFNVAGSEEQLAFGGIYLFELSDAQRLDSVAYAGRADLGEGRRWRLQNFRQTRFAERDVYAEQLPQTTRQYNVDAELLGIAALRPGSLSFRGLIAYLDYLKTNQLDSRAYETELWSRVSDVLATLLMPLLAIGFVFGSLRSAGAGARLLLGVLIGLAFFLASRTLANSSQVFGLESMVVGLIPVAVLALATMIAIQRVR
ncbi:MAG: LPS export ABC transporter permease LptG [Pseudomonadota bacterium]